MSRLDHPSYALISLGGGKVARIDCARCRASLDVPIRPGINHSALVPQKARQAGWLFNARHPSKCFCRECYLGPKEEPAPLPIAPAIQASKGEGALADALRQALVKKPEDKPMNLPPMTDGPRKPTPEQLLRIRQELDGHYDESRRCYLERQTDKTLAERCGVPWAWVRDLREVAYGPLEADSELVEIREEMRRLDDAYGELGNRLETALKRLQAAEERLSR